MVPTTDCWLNGKVLSAAIWALHYGNGIGYHIGDDYWITNAHRIEWYAITEIGYWLLA